MALTVAQKNELATRLVNAQQTNNYGSFNDLVKQLRLTQADLLSNFPAINQAGIDEQISRGAVVPKTAPAAVTYTTGQVSAAIKDALNAGFTVQQARQGAMTNFGLSSEEFDKALKSVQSSTYNTTFTDERVAQAIRDSLAQGFTLDQAREGALNNYGVGADQFNRAYQMVANRPDTYRGSAPTFQFPGLLGGRQDMPTGAQRFLAQRPGSLLFDVPKVEGGEFTFTPGAFDYQAIRDQLGTSATQAIDSETAANSNALAAAQVAAPVTTATMPVVKPVTTPVVTAPKTATTYTDAQVAQALRESMAQGFSLDQSKYGATTKYGISQAQLDRALALMTPGETSGSSRVGDEKRVPQVIRPSQATPVTGAQQASAMDAAYFQSLLQSPEYGGKVYGEGVQQLPGLPPNLSKAALAKLFPQGTSEYIPQEVSVSIPDYFGYIAGTPEFDTYLERARAAQRAFSSAGTGQSPADQEYEMKNYLNNLAGGLPMTGGVSQGAKPLLPLLTAMDVAAGRMTSEQADALQFLVSNAENYNRLQQDIPMWEQQGYTAYLEKQKPYFEQLGKAFKDYGGKLSGLDVGSLSSRELFSLIPEAGRVAQTAAQGGLLAPVTQLAGSMNAPVEQTPIAPVVPVAQPAIMPVAEPTQVQTNLLANPSRFSDAQIAQAIIDSLGQGFNMDQIRMGAFNNFGVTPEQFTSASAMLPSMGYNIGGGFQ